MPINTRQPIKSRVKLHNSPQNIKYTKTNHLQQREKMIYLDNEPLIYNGYNSDGCKHASSAKMIRVNCCFTDCKYYLCNCHCISVFPSFTCDPYLNGLKYQNTLSRILHNFTGSSQTNTLNRVSEWVMAQRPTRHFIGHFRVNLYRPDDPTNRIKALKEASWPLTETPNLFLVKTDQCLAV